MGLSLTTLYAGLRELALAPSGEDSVAVGRGRVRANKSTPRLAKEWVAQGHPVRLRTVCDWLAKLDDRLPATRKTREGSHQADRDAPFSHLAATAAQYQTAGDPVVSVATKKQERVGDFKHGGREWPPKGRPEDVRVDDCIDPQVGKAAPSGVYAVGANPGWVSVGITHDTATFAVESIRRWWREMGQPLYPPDGAAPADHRRLRWQ